MRIYVAALLLSVCLLSACGRAATSYRYVPINNPGGRMCAGQCKDSREFCEQRCKLSQRACSTEMQEQALKDYEQYMREQLREHKQPDLHMSDFERPERCSTDYCDDDCEDDYQQCYVNCGGEIKRITSCRFLCF